MQEARAQVVRQQQALMSAQQPGNAQGQQQGGPPPGVQAPQMRPPPSGQPQAQQQQGQQQPQQPHQGGPPRIAPNGQPMANMAASQQQLLTAVAAANAVRQNASNGPSPVNGQNGTPVNGVRPLPQQGQAPNPQLQQQMQMLQAQQHAARQAAQAQQSQNRVASGGSGTPRSQSGNLSASPYSHPTGELPNGEGMSSSPALPNAAVGPHSSPSNPGVQQMGRAPSLPQGHLRIPSGNSTGSPQMANQLPQPAGQQPGAINNAYMQQIIAQIQASGQAPTPETLRHLSANYPGNLSANVMRSVGALAGGRMHAN